MDEKENNVEQLDLELIAQQILEDEQANDPDPDTLGFNGVEGVTE